MFVLIFGRPIRYIPTTASAFSKRNGAPATARYARASSRSPGEAGFQPDVLRGGYHVFRPSQYRVHTVPLVTIPQGQIGYVFARDGVALPPTQTLASNATRRSDFEDVRGFLAAGGQKGPQRKHAARRHLRHQPRAIRGADRRIAPMPIEHGATPTKTLFGKHVARCSAERDGFEPIVIDSQARHHRHRHRP